MKTIATIIFILGFVCGAIIMALKSQASQPVMTVDWASQQCLHVDGDASKCSLYDKSDVIVVNSAF